MDEINKMHGWKGWLKGVVDGRSPEQALLVTGSTRMETFRQVGDSLAGRYFAFRLHPFSVREWREQQHVDPAVALGHLLERGGFPDPCLAGDSVLADRWRAQYFNDLIREDVLEFSHLHEFNPPTKVGGLPSLPAPQMVNELVIHLTRAPAPVPPVEAILHAVLP